MADVVVRAEGLGKRFRLGQREAYTTLRETVMRVLQAPFRRARDTSDREVWALREVGFEVEANEVVGFIGRNGAGKSTLLRILAGITEPSEGQVQLWGRVGSLLEVGTGFHPELTGRENVFLNGAILGMSRREIAAKFDEIVAFAEVERFLDTPVKRYSSGMYMRLAFAVAAHLEPEVLLVDEVLAVGDTRFQRKCLAKMQDVGEQGRAVLFVSHDMSAVLRLCRRAVLLDQGRVVRAGPTHEVVNAYLSSGLGTTAAREWPDPGAAPGDEVVRLRAVRVRSEAGEVTDVVDIRRPVGVELDWEVRVGGRLLVPNFHFYNAEGVYLFPAGDMDPAWAKRSRPEGRWVTTAWVPGNFFAEGTITVGAAVSTIEPSVEVHAHERDAVAFQVVDRMEGGSVRGDWAGAVPGVVRPMLRWETRAPGEASAHPGPSKT